MPNVVDVVSFGGITREYQVRIDPDKLVAYGLSIGQVEQQLANNNVNAGGSFIEAGLQQINVRAVGLVRNVHDIEETVIKTQNGTPIRVSDIGTVRQGPKIRLGQIGKAIHRADGKIIDNDDVVEGIVLLRKGADSDATLDAIHDKVKELNEHILPPGVKIVPFLDRSDLVHYTTHTVLHNLTEGIILVALILFLFLGNVRGALIVALTIPFSLLFASICLSLEHIPANLLSLGALDFGMVVEGAVVMVENIVRHLGREREAASNLDPHPRGRARSAAAGVLRHRHHHHRLPADLHAAARGRAAVQAHGLDRGFRAAGRADVLHADRAGAVQLRLRQEREGMAQPGDGLDHRRLSRMRCGAAIRFRWVTVAVAACGAGGVSAYLMGSGIIGSEFLPHLDEGAIWARGTLAPSTGPTEGTRVMNQARVILASFPEVTQVVSQVGRPDDGTDTTGFFNTEYFVDLKPKEAVAARLPPEQGRADRRHGPRAGEDPRRALELLAAHRRQHGRSRQRRQGRTGHQDLRRRPEDAGSQGRRDRRT